MFTPISGHNKLFPASGKLHFPRARLSFSPLSDSYPLFRPGGSLRFQPIRLSVLPDFSILTYRVLDAISMLTQVLAPGIRVMGVHSVAADVVNALSGLAPRSAEAKGSGPPEVPPGQAKKETPQAEPAAPSIDPQPVAPAQPGLPEQIEKAVERFVHSYNKLLKYIDKRGGEGEALAQSLREAVQGARKQLEAVGIAVSNEGTLALADYRSAQASPQHEVRLREALVAESGAARRVEQVLCSVLSQEAKVSAEHQDYRAAVGRGGGRVHVQIYARGRLFDARA